HHLLALVLYVVIASLVSFIVDRAARYTRAARRSAAESELIQTIAGSVLRGENAIQALVDRVREAFHLPGVRVVVGGEVVARAGEPLPDGRFTDIPLTDEAVLELHGADLAASERRLLGVVTAQLRAALDTERLEKTAQQIEPIAASDRVRGALLSALSHDLRRPLAAASAAVGGLRAAGPELAAADRQELLETADESLTALGTLLTDLLDVSRLQTGVLTIADIATDPAEAIAPALDELQLGPADVTLALQHGDAVAHADPVLLQRVLVNLLANAHRYAPAGVPVHVSTSTFGDRLEIRIVDRGPGVPAEKKDDIFVPFQRLGDTDNSSGLGLGLALSRGFIEAMRGTLTSEDTPGGGLTMVISLRTAGETDAAAGVAADVSVGEGERA
ncbi:sensor histidine kinase, partial [Microbacterium sp. zg.Y909]